MAKSRESIAEQTRREAEEYMNQIGAENVISIVETDHSVGFSVVVWHYTS
jgi:hypothetical protein